jgi:hypothetical protein
MPKKYLVPEHELIKLPPLPAAPAVRAPRAPAVPRAPPAPPKTLEEIIKEFPKPLTKVKWVTMIRPVRAEEPIPRSEWTHEQRNYYEIAGITPTREVIKQEVEEVEVPEWLNIFIGREGDFYYVRDYRLVPTTREGIYEHVRRALRPITPAPRRAAPPLFKPMWPFKGGPAFPEIKRGMTDTEIKENFSKRGITLTDDGLKFFKQRYGLEG